MMTDTGGRKQSVDGAELAVEQLAKGGADHQHTHSTLVTMMLITGTVITSIHTDHPDHHHWHTDHHYNQYNHHPDSGQYN